MFNEDSNKIVINLGEDVYGQVTDFVRETYGKKASQSTDNRAFCFGWGVVFLWILQLC